MRGDLIAAALITLSGCAEASCPAGTSAIGTFSVSFTAVDAGDTCVVTRSADGGPTDAGLVSELSDTELAFCAQSDGGPELYLWFYGSSAKKISLDGGSFSTSAGASDVTGSNCLCALDISETISGRIWAADGGPPVVLADGGLAPLAGFSAQIDEKFHDHQSGEDCACNLPCGVHYSFSGGLQ
jgi:hypothetical protein